MVPSILANVLYTLTKKSKMVRRKGSSLRLRVEGCLSHPSGGLEMDISIFKPPPVNKWGMAMIKSNIFRSRMIRFWHSCSKTTHMTLVGVPK